MDQASGGQGPPTPFSMDSSRLQGVSLHIEGHLVPIHTYLQSNLNLSPLLPCSIFLGHTFLVAVAGLQWISNLPHSCTTALESDAERSLSTRKTAQA